MATTVPARALRTGTAVRPRPGSSAIRAPMPLVTGPADVSVAASQDGRVRAPAGRLGYAERPATRVAATARQAGPASSASGSAAMTAKPMARHGHVEA